MKLKFIPFCEAAALQISNSALIAKTHTTALAFAIANMAHIPTSVVDNPSSHFNLQLLPGINQIISEWNEEIIFDARECIEQVRSFWLIRYTAAHPNSRIIYSFGHSFFETMVGVNVYASAEFTQFLNDNKTQVLNLAGIAEAIISKGDQ